ncbi:Pal1-domain-containing protein [Saccharata proteae CBS 121410]|uniref:Pal1-domain-containing protein n=1 Tax=Saccharata proteae CBS 121410 TaxID=1314787 RepID=A0A9P4I1J7_9PEZI|nr:Pal1-domain-containing protein [Saccharata proteae CBS 121410]
MDKSTVDDERRRRERRHRERERRERDGRDGKDGKDGKERSGRGDRPQRKPKGLDLIDKLDVTGIYGPSLFHHDGPFDACNPHRNRKKDHRAPMQAFPEGSANNAMGGSGPVNKNINLDRFHGREAEGFNDFGTLPPRPGEVDLPIKKPSSNEPFYNPKQNIEQVHGDFTEGLGTSTFLEGAPASRRDLQRRDSEEDQKGFQGGGLARKKSLAQRIRGISQPRRDYGGREVGGRIQSPESRYEHRPPPPPPGQASPGGDMRPPPGPQSAGGNLKMYETNPFFDDYDDAYEKKGASIKVTEASSSGRARAPSSPQRPAGLSRTRTTGSSGPADFPEPPRTQPSAGGGGLINRMKSLKGGKRPRPERNVS